MQPLADRPLGRFCRPRRRLRADLVQLLCVLAGLVLGLPLPRITTDATVASTRVTDVLIGVGFGALGPHQCRGRAHPDTVAARNNLGMAYRVAGYWSKPLAVRNALSAEIAVVALHKVLRAPLKSGRSAVRPCP